MAEPDEITRLGLFVASDDASFSTGSEFIVDGGESLDRLQYESAVVTVPEPQRTERSSR